MNEWNTELFPMAQFWRMTVFHRNCCLLYCIWDTTMLMQLILCTITDNGKIDQTDAMLYVFMHPGSSSPGVTTDGPPNLGLRMEPLDIAVVVIYFLIVLAVGIWVSVSPACLPFLSVCPSVLSVLYQVLPLCYINSAYLGLSWRVTA